MLENRSYKLFEVLKSFIFIQISTAKKLCQGKLLTTKHHAQVHVEKGDQNALNMRHPTLPKHKNIYTFKHTYPSDV